MLIKKHFFNYPEIKNNIIDVANLRLDGFDDVIIKDLLLIVRIGNFYNFYLPSLEDGDRFNNNVICIFNTIKEYHYEKGLLFIKDDDNWIIIEPNQFSWYLTDSNVSSRKATSPRIPYAENDNIEFLDFKSPYGFFIKTKISTYWIQNNVSSLSVMPILGSIRTTKLFSTIIISNKNTESFFKNGTLSPKYRSIREMKWINGNFFGYLCFSDSICKTITALKVGISTPCSPSLNYSYDIEFNAPLKSITFIKQDDIRKSINTNLPDFALHIWLIETFDGEQKYLIQGIGEYQFSSIIPKEDFNI